MLKLKAGVCRTIMPPNPSRKTNQCMRCFYRPSNRSYWFLHAGYCNTELASSASLMCFSHTVTNLLSLYPRPNSQKKIASLLPGTETHFSVPRTSARFGKIFGEINANMLPSNLLSPVSVPTHLMLPRMGSNDRIHVKPAGFKNAGVFRSTKNARWVSKCLDSDGGRSRFQGVTSERVNDLQEANTLDLDHGCSNFVKPLNFVDEFCKASEALIVLV